MRTRLYGEPDTTSDSPSAPLLPEHKGEPDHCIIDSQSELHAHCEEVKDELRRYGFKATHASRVGLVLDISLSMDNLNQFYYPEGYDRTAENLKYGKVQRLMIKALSLAAELSSDEHHNVTVIPFGKVAHSSIEIEEHGIDTATADVLESIHWEFDDRTNYHAPQVALRRQFCNDSGPRTTIQQTDQPPAFILWVTDGDSNMKPFEALNEFRYSKYNPMFIKIIALRGKQKNLQFEKLREIASQKGILPNVDLVILDDPNELTIQTLFKGYRVWLQEAHEHGMLLNDPGIEFANPDDQAELRQLAALELEHAHDDHSHNPGAPSTSRAGHSYRFYANNPQARQQLNPPESDDCCNCTVM